MRTLLDRLTTRFAGRTVAVLASGPSLTLETVAKVRAAGIPAIVTNRTYELAPWADVLVGNDLAWWQATPAALRFEGLKVCLQDGAPDGVVTLQGDDRRDARAGGNSGYTATWLLAKAGVARILLCGLDLRGDHWHGPHVAPLRTTPPYAHVERVRRFANLAIELRGRVEVRNCSPASALKCFMFCDLDDALASARDELLEMA